MQLKQLTLAVLTATSLLVACSDEPKKSDKGTKTEQTALKAADLPQKAEEQYKANLALAAKTYENLYAQNPMRGLTKYQITVNDYQRGDNSATAKSTLTLEFSPRLFGGNDIGAITLDSHDTITYSQELLAKGIVAHVENHIDTDNVTSLKAVLKEQLHASDANIERLVSILKNLKMQSDIYADDNVVATAEVAPFQVQEGDDSLDFKGLKEEVRYNMKTMPDGIFDLNLAVEPFTFTATDKKDGGSATVAVSPLKGGYGIKEDGSFTVKVEPIKIEVTAKDGLTIFELDGVTGSGSGVKYDSALMTYLGDIESNVNNIRVTHNGEQYPIGDINGKSSTQKTASGNYDASGEFTFKIDGATVKKIEPSIPVEPQSLRVKIKISELSAQSQLDLLQGFEALQQSLNIAAKTSDVGYMDKDKATAEATVNLEKSQADYEKIAQEKFSAALQEAIKNKTRLNYELEGVTDSGKATFSADVGIRADSATPPEAWQKAIADVQNNPMALQELLKNNLDLHAEARINKSLTDKLGVSQFIESQGAMFITVEGEDYVAKLENDNGTLKLNGKPLPF